MKINFLIAEVNETLWHNLKIFIQTGLEMLGFKITFKNFIILQDYTATKNMVEKSKFDLVVLGDFRMDPHDKIEEKMLSLIHSIRSTNGQHCYLIVITHHRALFQKYQEYHKDGLIDEVYEKRGLEISKWNKEKFMLKYEEKNT